MCLCIDTLFCKALFRYDVVSTNFLKVEVSTDQEMSMNRLETFNESIVDIYSYDAPDAISMSCLTYIFSFEKLYDSMFLHMFALF